MERVSVYVMFPLSLSLSLTFLAASKYMQFSNNNKAQKLKVKC
jgi:hypothetical protein